MPTTPSPPRVLVTGIGLSTGLGWCRESSWQALCDGRSAITQLPQFPGLAGAAASGYLGGHDGLPLAHLASYMATNDASGRDDRLAEPERVAVLVGMSKGGLHSLDYLMRGMTPPHPPEYWAAQVWRTKCWPSSAAAMISGRGFRGPSLSPNAACATGLVAAIQGAELIRRGVCDVALCGAADASLVPLILGAFRNMKALARVDGDPTRAIRPWHRGRSGFLVGEGAAILVLEREEHALARGVLPYAVFAGGAFGSDAYHITDLNPEPTGLADLIGIALKNSKVEPTEIDYVNVHGTATRQNDPLECQAIRLAFGAHADSLSCSANKPQIGHLLGAAGAAELAITCLAIRDGFVPPTLNLDDPDPLCDLDGTPHVGKYREIRAALKLSIGFGGHLAAAVLRRYEGPRRLPGPYEPEPDDDGD